MLQSYNTDNSHNSSIRPLVNTSSPTNISIGWGKGSCNLFLYHCKGGFKDDIDNYMENIISLGEKHHNSGALSDIKLIQQLKISKYHLLKNEK